MLSEKRDESIFFITKQKFPSKVIYFKGKTIHPFNIHKHIHIVYFPYVEKQST